MLAVKGILWRRCVFGYAPAHWQRLEANALLFPGGWVGRSKEIYSRGHTIAVDKASDGVRYEGARSGVGRRVSARYVTEVPVAASFHPSAGTLNTPARIDYKA